MVISSKFFLVKLFVILVMPPTISVGLLSLVMLAPQCMIKNKDKEISRALRKRYPTRSIPVFKLTRNLKCFFLKCSFLLKPTVMESPYETKYSRVDQVNFVEGSL